MMQTPDVRTEKMWDVVKGTSKYMYVSNPSRGGGLHNYGLAVDISIADSLGHPLPTGTEVDYMDAASHITNEAKISKRRKNNPTRTGKPNSTKTSYEKCRISCTSQ